MSQAVEVSVVMPCLDAKGTIEAQLRALAGQRTSARWEVIVSDNGSTDGSQQIVQRWQARLPDLRLIDSSSRRGVSAARNFGARAARGELILICDADDIVSEHWIAAMVRAARQFDLVGGSFEESSLNPPVLRFWRGELPRDRLLTSLRFLPFAMGCNVGMRREVFEALGGWDERYVGGCDDVDFSWRAQLGGFTLGFAPDAVIAYRHRHGLTALCRQFYRYGLSHAVLYRQYRSHGATARPLWQVLRSWAWLLLHAADLVRSSKLRGRWLRAAALNWGQVRGSIKQRVFSL